MPDKNKLSQSGVDIQPLIIAVKVIVIVWIIGNGALMLISSAK